MLSVKLSQIAAAEVVPWEKDEYGIAYVTTKGLHAADRIGSKAKAEALVRKIKMVEDTAAIYPKDIAAS
jgi:hypothetical protein